MSETQSEQVEARRIAELYERTAGVSEQGKVLARSYLALQVELDQARNEAEQFATELTNERLACQGFTEQLDQAQEREKALREALKRISISPPADPQDLNEEYWSREAIHCRTIARQALAPQPEAPQDEWSHPWQVAEDALARINARTD